MAEKRRIKVSFEKLVLALESHSLESQGYLDTETGEVIYVTGEARNLLEELYDRLNPEEQKRGISLETLLAGHEAIPDWEEEMLRNAYRVEQEFSRFLSIEPEPYSDYNDMDEFIGTIEDERLRERLDEAIHGKGAFRRFKDVLAHHPKVLEDWYIFKDDQVRQRVLDWLEPYDIEMIES